MAVRTNLVPNPSVEVDTTGWTAATYNSVARVSGGLDRYRTRLNLDPDDQR